MILYLNIDSQLICILQYNNTNIKIQIVRFRNNLVMAYTKMSP